MVDYTSIMAHYDAGSEGGGDHLIVRAASPQHRKLVAGYAARPQMAGRRVRMLALLPLWRYAHDG